MEKQVMVNKAKLEKFLEILYEIIHEPGSWGDKRRDILNECNSDDKVNIEEFCGWFEEDF